MKTETETQIEVGDRLYPLKWLENLKRTNY